MTQLELLNRIASVKVLVVGDLILDTYRIAGATRISPEAPVPVLLNSTVEHRPGGAGAVAAMCAALGAETVLLSVIGNDHAGEQVVACLEAAGVGVYPVTDPSRPTTVKERICGVASGRHRQQIVRVDTESTSPLNPDLSGLLAATISGMTNDVDLVLIADYAKGVCTDAVAMACIDGSPICIVDPPRDGFWNKYRHASCLVPNREEAAGMKPLDLVTEYNLQAAVVKLDQDGCRLQDDVIPMTRAIHARARAVHDVTGAGDQFVAVLGCARAGGASWFEAAELANTAAGLQVERHGCCPVTLAELTQEIEQCQSVPC